MSSETKKCPVCDSNAFVTDYHDPVSTFVQCPVCGRFEYCPMEDDLTKFNLNHLASFFIYNGFKDGSLHHTEYRYFTTMSKEKCDEYRAEFNKGNIQHGHPVHLSVENVENWYPKRLTDKIDLIINFINSRTEFIGQLIRLDEKIILGSFFIDVHKYDNGRLLKNHFDTTTQIKYMMNLLDESKMLVYPPNYKGPTIERPLQLSPEAYARIEKLEKDNKHGKKVLVAMRFGDETKKLRESIRRGILDSQYNPIFIDEVEHNDFITPELLKHIRDSKFIVVDLSHQNNGAYFEEGYAMGLGKPVIQLCKKEVKLHFDVAQKNTIMWSDEEEIPLKLKNRIIATID